MAVYVDYSFYTQQFKGTAIAAVNFDRLALRASEVIDQVTFDQAGAITDELIINKIKMAACAVAEEMQSLEEAGGAVESERVGSYSITYLSKVPAEVRLVNAAKRYLWNTGLMYRGEL
jgi:hypothetical protein